VHFKRPKHYQNDTNLHHFSNKHTHTHVSTHTCVHTHTYMHACTHVRAHMFTNMCTHTYTYTRSHMRTDTHAHTHAHRHACAHARTHTRTQGPQDWERARAQMQGMTPEQLQQQSMSAQNMMSSQEKHMLSVSACPLRRASSGTLPVLACCGERINNCFNCVKLPQELCSLISSLESAFLFQCVYISVWYLCVRMCVRRCVYVFV
jgi:hypothetical protein